MLILALVLIGIRAMNEVNSSRVNTNRLVTKQISHIVNYLDTFRMTQQIEFITKTVFDLEEVESVALFDEECEDINRQPLNFQTSWMCKTNNLEKNTVAYEVKNSWADSVGSPRFIYVKLKDSYSIFTASSILDLVVVLIAIGATLYFLVFLIREKIINPLHPLRSTICSQGELTWDSSCKDKLPVEEMEGNISISSTPKVGTQVLIKVPVAINDYQSCGTAPYDYAFI